MSPPLRLARDRIVAAFKRAETGESLVETLVTIVIIGIVASASFFAISAGATTSKSQRNFVTADQLLRNYAEAAKNAARDQCTTANAGTGTFTVGITAPPGFTVVATGLNCPSLATVSKVHITATLPDTTKRVLDIDVRTP